MALLNFAVPAGHKQRPLLLSSAGTGPFKLHAVHAEPPLPLVHLAQPMSSLAHEWPALAAFLFLLELVVADLAGAAVFRWSLSECGRMAWSF